jgi:ATP-binding cassette subfamily F protein 3
VTQKIAFVGQNGQGKSTLAKIIVGEIPYDGLLKLGHNVEIGYFAQNQAEYLDGTKTVLETMTDAANASNRTKVRDILGAFLFRGDDVDKPVKVLSGGERNRLALAKLLLQPFNMLIMDEPTNHLDMASKRVLKEALKRFQGTLIIVSHDRDFLQGLSQTVYEFKEHKIKEYLGGIDYFLDQRQLDNLREAEKRSVAVSIPKESQKQSYEQQKQLKTLNNKISTIERKIDMLEKEISEDDYQLEMNYDQTASDPEFFNQYQSKKTDLEALMLQWEELQQRIENFNN